jgi:DNA-binding NarL/FixJ family response regulator
VAVGQVPVRTRSGTIESCWLVRLWEARCGAVVVVEDSFIYRKALDATLDRCAWVELVGTAGDGIEGLDLITKLRPTVAVIDMRLPGLSGLAIIETVSGSASTRLLALSGDTRGELVHAALLAARPATSPRTATMKLSARRS